MGEAQLCSSTHKANKPIHMARTSALQEQLSESNPDPLFQFALLVYPLPSSSFMELSCPF